MKRNLTKLFQIIISVLLVILSVTLTATASETQKNRIQLSMNDFLNHTGRIIGISSKGEWDEFPENTLESIKEAAKTDIDFVLVDVKKAACSTLILFSDNNTERMLCADKTYIINDSTYEELSRYKLKKNCGGSNEEASSCVIPTLEQAITQAKECDIPLILNCDASVITDICKVLQSNDAFEMCILLCDSNKKDIDEQLNKCEKKPYLIGAIQSNVIFSVFSFNSFLNNNDCCVGLELRTKNRYGINYYKSLLNKYSQGLRVIANPTTPEICGARQDTEKWWDDLISRGYNTIITDHADIFCEYINQNNTARERLNVLYDKYVTNHTLPVFKDEALNDFKKAYTDATNNANALLSDNSSSTQDLTDGYAMLFKSANDVNKNFAALEDGSAGVTISLSRILLCILAAIAVVSVQIYFYKRRKKEG